MKRSVVFVCVHNSARSQMAGAFLNQRCSDDFVAESAGLEPGKLNPLAVAAMREVGIDIWNKHTKCTFDLLKRGKHYSYDITVCDETSAERSPTFPGGARRLLLEPSPIQQHWKARPTERLAQTRLIRDQIRAKIDTWCGSLRAHSANRLSRRRVAAVRKSQRARLAVDCRLDVVAGAFHSDAEWSICLESDAFSGAACGM